MKSGSRLFRRMRAQAVLALLLLGAMRPAAAEGCLAGEFNPFTPYDGAANAVTTVTNNAIFIGNARLQLSSGGTGGGSMAIGSHFATDIGVRTTQLGAVSPSLYHDANYDFRNPANLAQYLPVDDLTFVLYDVDAGDNVIVNAYDQNGALIALTAAMYSFDTSTGTPVVSYAGANRFTASLTDISNQRGTVRLAFSGLQVRRVVLRYWDVSASGTYTAAGWGGCNASLVLTPGPAMERPTVCPAAASAQSRCGLFDGPIPALPRSGIWKRTSPTALVRTDREAAGSRPAHPRPSMSPKTCPGRRTRPSSD
jgi:hypothetical protein